MTRSPSRSAGLSCIVALPRRFRAADLLAFHSRDPQSVAERTAADRLEKGVAWGGRPACLTIEFHPGEAHVELAVDGGLALVGADALARTARRMLGLTQPVEAFERAHRAHPQLGPLIARRRGLRVAVSATPFEALTWAVTGQQISVKAALSLRRNLIRAAGLAHSGGLACYPDAAALAGLGETALRAAGFSQAKARTLMTVSSEVEGGRLPLDDWAAAPPVAEIAERLLEIPGIGPWTVSYALLRGFGWLDGSLHGDVAVRRGLQWLLGLSEKMTAAETERWLAEFSPWRALVAAHLWAAAPKRASAPAD